MTTQILTYHNTKSKEKHKNRLFFNYVLAIPIKNREYTTKNRLEQIRDNNCLSESVLPSSGVWRHYISWRTSQWDNLILVFIGKKTVQYFLGTQRDINNPMVVKGLKLGDFKLGRVILDNLKIDVCIHFYALISCKIISNKTETK